jgi:Flp pilus assembly protein TadG
MGNRAQLWNALRRNALRRRFLSGYAAKTEGAELVEFAISLPFLIVLVVGTYDFGAAFTMREKLNSAAAEGAKVASSQSTTDLGVNGTCGAPTSVCIVRDVVDSYLQNSGVTDCGLSTASATSAGTRAWKFDVSCGGTLELQIERGAWYTTNLAAPYTAGSYRIEASKITLSYPYQWQFNRAAGLLGGNFVGSNIIVISTMQNIN